MKVAIYARESSDDTNKAPPISKQIEIGEQWIKQNNHELYMTFADNGYSGGDWKRPEWLKSVNEAKRHSYHILWVWNQDRLARDTEQFLYYCRNLKEGYVRIFEHTSNDYIDMESLGNRVKHTSLAQAAEIFRLVTSEKVKSKYQSKKKELGKNLKWGRPSVVIEPNTIAKALELRNKGMGFRSISKELGINYQTLRRRLNVTQ